MSKKIAVMCGHGTSTDGNWDSGCTYSGYTEAGLMLPITKSAVKYLRASGITVISDADNNNNKNMIADVNWANSEKVSLYLSIHCDYSGAPTGVMPLYTSAEGKKIATSLNNQIKADMSMKSRGLSKRTDLWELNGTDMPACILETGSIKADLSTLKKSDAYGKAIAKGICDYLEVKFVEASATATTKDSSVVKTWKLLQKTLGVKQTGYAGGQNKSLTPYYPSLKDICKYDGGSGKSDTIKALQKKIGAEADGVMGKDTVKKWQAYLNRNQIKYVIEVDGIFGSQSLKALNEWLENPQRADSPLTAKDKFIKACKEYGKTIQSTFAYSNSNAKTTWAAAKGNKIVNCARYMSWCLQYAGILSSGKVVYWKNNKWHGSGASQLQKSSKVTILKPNKTTTALAKSGYLKAGDIVMHKGVTHMMAVKSVDAKTGKVMWYSAGSSDMKAKNVTNRRKSSYDSKTVACIVRIK